MNWDEADHRFMSRALQLAKRGLNTTHPNPRVGCVLVRDGAVVGEGWHQSRGAAHAEINALQAAGGSASGASCYVTLEPCNHSGHTGPCTEALIEAGITRVIAAMADPNPQVAGAGLARLAEAGMAAEAGLMKEQAESLNAGFIMRMTARRPYLRCKLAMSLDGRTAMASGESKWITSTGARRDVQALRAASSAIMTGSNTLLLDDPGLDVRDEDTGDRQVLRVVLDRRLRCPPSARMLGLEGRTLVFTQNDSTPAHRALRKAGAEPVLLDENGFLDAVMHYLAETEEVNEVLLEAGASLCGALLEEGFIDELILYQAPVLLGDSARALFHLPSIKSMADRLELVITDSRMLGVDRRTTYKLVKR